MLNHDGNEPRGATIMRRIDKETFKAFKINGFMGIYYRLTNHSAEELEIAWEKCKWPEDEKAAEMCKALFRRAYKTVVGRKKGIKKVPQPPKVKAQDDIEKSITCGHYTTS